MQIPDANFIRDFVCKSCVKRSFLETRFELGYKILLYAVGNFYVEVYYSDTLNEITKIGPFRYIDILKPYLDNIGIKDLSGLP